MQEALARMIEISDDPRKFVVDCKQKNNKKVIGCMPMAFPKEIIDAAGMLPVNFWSSGIPISEGNRYTPTTHCGFSRSFVDDQVRGVNDFMDGMVFYDTCLVSRGMAFAARTHNSPACYEFVHLSPQNTPAARDYTISRLQDFKANLEKFGGQEITTESLKRSISVFNENRELLEKLYQLRREKPGILKAKEMVAVVHAGMLMPKEDHNELLKTLLKELEAKQDTPQGRAKVILSGYFCHRPRIDVLDLLDEAGGIVVDDDLYYGTRYFANPVDTTKEPIEALVDRFMQTTPPDPTRVNAHGTLTDWGDYLASIVKRSQAQGVIHMLTKFCPPHQAWLPDTKRTLAAAGIRDLELEIEYESVNLAPIRTRLEMFIETIANR